MTIATVVNTAIIDRRVLTQINLSLFTIFYQELHGQKGMLENQPLHEKLYALFTLVPCNIQEPSKTPLPNSTRKC